MAKAQGLGMQMHATGTAGIPVDRISHDGMAPFGQMGPQLMGAPRERTQPEPRAVGTSGAGSPDRQRQTTLRVAAVARRLARETRQRAGDDATAVELPLHLRLIELVDSSFSKQGTEPPQGVSASGQEQHPRGVAVQAVNQAQALILLLQAGDHGIALLRPQARLAQQASGLIDRYQPWVPHQQLQRESRLAQCFSNKATTCSSGRA